jgi:hypothetical protein
MDANVAMETLHLVMDGEAEYPNDDEIAAHGTGGEWIQEMQSTFGNRPKRALGKARQDAEVRFRDEVKLEFAPELHYAPEDAARVDIPEPLAIEDGTVVNNVKIPAGIRVNVWYKIDGEDFRSLIRSKHNPPLPVDVLA